MDYTKLKGCHPGGDPVGLKGPNGMNTLSSYQAGRDDMITIIKAEIERLKKEELTRNSIGVITGSAFFVSANELLSFLSTLESGKPIEQDVLLEEVKRYYSENFEYLSSDQPTLSILTNIARHFAEWGAEHTKK